MSSPSRRFSGRGRVDSGAGRGAISQCRRRRRGAGRGVPLPARPGRLPRRVL